MADEDYTQQYTNVFVCRCTGAVHICDPSTCTMERMRGHSKTLICPISNYIMGSEWSAPSFAEESHLDVLRHKKHVSDQSTVRRVDENGLGENEVILQHRRHARGQHHLTNAQAVALIAGEVDDAAACAVGALLLCYQTFPKGTQSTYYRLARGIVRALLFSPERQAIERDNFARMRNEAHDAMRKHVEQCARLDHAPSVTTLRVLCASKFKKPVYPVLYVRPDSILDRFVAHYAWVCCHFFDTLLAQELDEKEISTEGGREKPLSLSDFPSFVVAVLYRLSIGMTIEDLQVLPRDVFLATFMPEINVMETLDTVPVTKKKYTSTQKQIVNMILTVMKSGVIPPYQLRVPMLRYEEDVIRGVVPISQLYSALAVEWAKKSRGRPLNTIVHNGDNES